MESLPPTKAALVPLGRDVPLSKKLANFLSLPNNKADFANLLSEELCSQAPADKEIVVAGGFREEREVRSSNTTTDLTKLSLSTALVALTCRYAGDICQFPPFTITAFLHLLPISTS